MPAKRFDLLGNRLVLVGPKGSEPMAEVSVQTLLERLGNGRLAIGQTQSVPAGIYARQWLENAGFWGALAPYLAETENVRAALALVSRGEAPLGIVYKTDIRAARDIVILYDVPDEMHDKVVYAIAKNNLRSNVQSSEFLEFLRRPEVVKIFRSHGFEYLLDPV